MAARPAWAAGSMTKLESELVVKYGAAERERLVRGMEQVLSLWRASDGDAAVFEAFVRGHFAARPRTATRSSRVSNACSRRSPAT